MDGCGYSCWHPQWLHKFAKTRWYIVIYALLGTLQTASSTYFNITLTTMENRFRFPSETTGIVLSGNEVSQILLALILSYFGGQNNIPKWISWGVVATAMSCFILASPHFIYGSGEEAFKYTEEYLSGFNNISIDAISQPTNVNDGKLCKNSTSADEHCAEEFSYVPLILIFLSQFVLGIGTTLYYSLGVAYIDDNSKQHKSPLLMSYAYAMRMFGPTLGYGFAFVILRIYINPTLTPVITAADPHWLGAWWLGWVVFGTLMFIFALLMGLFPKRIPKQNVVELQELNNEKCGPNHEKVEKTTTIEATNSLKDFPKAVGRLLKNKLVMLHCLCSTSIILSFSGKMTFMGRLMEVQFNKTSAGGSAFTGPLVVIGMSLGILVSGIVITKFRPRASYLLMWNVVVGFITLCITLYYTQLGCDNSHSVEVNGTIFGCDSQCLCDNVTYTPVCDSSTMTTYFSPCHAGCKSFDNKLNVYTNCDCPDDPMRDVILNRTITRGACAGDCNSNDYYIYSFTSMISNFLSLTGLMTGVLLSFRAVEPRDKALNQGFSLFVTGLFGFIPGPIIAGRIIDNACLIWNTACGRTGNCLLYDPIKFRYYLHSSSAFFHAIAIVFQCLTWYYGRKLNFYGDVDESKKSEQNVTRTDDMNESEPLKKEVEMM